MFSARCEEGNADITVVGGQALFRAALSYTWLLSVPVGKPYLPSMTGLCVFVRV